MNYLKYVHFHCLTLIFIVDFLHNCTMGEKSSLWQFKFLWLQVTIFTVLCVFEKNVYVNRASGFFVQIYTVKLFWNCSFKKKNMLKFLNHFDFYFKFSQFCFLYLLYAVMYKCIWNCFLFLVNCTFFLTWYCSLASSTFLC